MWVGNNVKLTLNGGTDKQVFSPSTAINSADIYTLSIDLGQNADVLKYSKNYYFRIGALADVLLDGRTSFFIHTLKIRP